MLIASILIVLAARAVRSQGIITSTSGYQYFCPAEDKAVQAYAPLCPLTLTDGTGLDVKSVYITYGDAPRTYTTTRDDQIQVACTYGRISGDSISGTNCIYRGGAGVTLTIQPGSSESCPGTTINNGANPRPSAGGNFRKRQSPAMTVQMAQPAFVCPRQVDSSQVFSVEELYQYDGTAGQPVAGDLVCGYRFADTFDGFLCGYRADTGVFFAGSATDCPLTSCSSPPYMSGMRKRSIQTRQVDTAKLRSRAAAPASGPARPKKKAVRRRKVLQGAKGA